MVTLKDGEPYSLWQPVSLAHRATKARLQLRRQAKFLPSQFPGKSSTSFWQQACLIQRKLLRNICCLLSRGLPAAPGHLLVSRQAQVCHEYQRALLSYRVQSQALSRV